MSSLCIKISEGGKKNMKNKEFPKDFLWGASTSAFQVEGGFNEERGIANSDMRHIPDGFSRL